MGVVLMGSRSPARFQQPLLKHAVQLYGTQEGVGGWGGGEYDQHLSIRPDK